LLLNYYLLHLFNGIFFPGKPG